jgi:hypothetical protein
LLWLPPGGRSGPQPFTHCWRSLAVHVVILSSSPAGHAATPESALASTTVFAPLSDALLELELEAPASALLELAPVFVDAEMLLASGPLVELVAAALSVDAPLLEAVADAAALSPGELEFDPPVPTSGFKMPPSGLALSPGSAAQAVNSAPATRKIGGRMAGRWRTDDPPLAGRSCGRNAA